MVGVYLNKKICLSVHKIIFAVLETLDSLIDWLIKNESLSSSVSRTCSTGVSDYIVLLVYVHTGWLIKTTTP